MRLCLIAAAIVAVSAGCGDLTEPPQAASTGPLSTVAVTTPERLLEEDRDPANLLANPSFEAGVEPWKPIGESSGLRSVPSVRRFGRAALRVTATDLATYGAVNVGAVVNPTRGDVYAFTAWLKADRSKDIALVLQVVRANNTVETIASKTERVGEEWHRIRIRGRVTSRNGVSLYIVVQVRRSIAIGDAFFMDAVTLDHTPPPR